MEILVLSHEPFYYLAERLTIQTGSCSSVMTVISCISGMVVEMLFFNIMDGDHAVNDLLWSSHLI